MAPQSGGSYHVQHGESLNMKGRAFCVREIAKTHFVDTVSKLPINNKLAAAVDAGAIELFEGDWLEKLADKIEKL